MPVTIAMAIAAYELSPATRATTHKTWSGVMSSAQPPRQRMGRAINGRQLTPEQQSRLRNDLRLQTTSGDHGDLLEARARRPPGARVDQVVMLAPASPAHAAGRSSLVAQQDRRAADADRPTIAVRS